jgi:hypothetical protein
MAEDLATFMLAAYRVVGKMTDAQWNAAFEEADKGTPIEITDPQCQILYKGPARALMLTLEEEWDGLDEDERVFLEAVHYHGCGPSDEDEMRFAEKLIRSGLIRDEPEGSEDAMVLLPLGCAVLRQRRRGKRG